MGRRKAETDPNFPTRCIRCMARGKDSYVDPKTGGAVDRCRTCPYTEAGRRQMYDDALSGGIIRRW